MKIFISHKKEDSYTANRIAVELNSLNISYYLDVMDQTVTKNGKELTDHIKANLNDCTDIIVVMSEHTPNSQWVPFEVGMSAQLDMPTATFLKENVTLPEFLEYWPRLKYPSDIRKYVAVRQRVELPSFLRHYDDYGKYRTLYTETSHSQEKLNIPEFYSALKQELK